MLGSTIVGPVATSSRYAEGIVESLARPGGNATGFFSTEPSLAGKWLELLKEIVPGLRRVAVIFSPETPRGSTSYLHSVETAAPLFSVEATGAPVHHAGDIELAISSLVREPGGGLIVLPGAFTASHLEQIIELAITREGAGRLEAGCARQCRASANGSIAASDQDNPHRLRNVYRPCRLDTGCRRSTPSAIAPIWAD
jgi:hypothetical protein